MKHLLLSIFFVFAITSKSQNFQWATSFGGANTEFINSMCTDAVGNIYAIGTFIDGVDFNPASNIYLMQTTPFDKSDVYVVKFDASGNFVWAKQIGGTDWDFDGSITIDANSDVIVTGYFSGTADLNPNAVVQNVTSVGSYDGFVLKLDAVGNFIWVKTIGGTGSDSFTKVITDGQNNIYLCGTFQGTVDINPGAGVLNVVANGTNTDLFIEKLDAAGNFVWGKNFGGVGVERFTSLALDPSANNIYAIGTFSTTTDFDPGAGITNTNSNGGKDVFIQKIDNSGSFQWVKTIGGSGDEFSGDIKISALGEIFVGIGFQNSVDADPGTSVFNLTSLGASDICLLKLNQTGSFLWAKQIGGINNEVPKALTINNNSGTSFLTSDFDGTIDFDPSAGVANLTSNGGSDVFIQSLDKDGNFLWAQNIVGTGTEFSNCLSLDNNNNLFVGGLFNNVTDFDPSASNFDLTPNGAFDDFILKLDMSTVAIKENKNEIFNINVYPNPSIEKITISANENIDEVELQLIDITGIQLINKNEFNLKTETLDISALASGVYFLKVSSDKQSSIVKIIKD